MFCSTECCGTVKDQFNYECVETEKGVQVNIEAKDPKKTESLKSLMRAHKDLCGCC